MKDSLHCQVNQRIKDKTSIGFLLLPVVLIFLILFFVFSFNSVINAWADNAVEKNNDVVEVYNDGTFQVTAHIDGLVNPTSGAVTCNDTITITNLTDDQKIVFNSVKMQKNSGFEEVNIANWEVKNGAETIFSGDSTTEYVPQFQLDHNASKIFNVSTTLTGANAGKLVNKIPFNFIYEYEAKNYELNYMVNIYGIGQDEVEDSDHVAGLTFGPATGETADCLHVDGHEEHGHAAGGHCICEDSWDEIIKNCNEGHADYYSACLDYHCAKSVPINLNSDIGWMSNNDELCSILQQTSHSGHLLGKYVKWNDSYSSSDCESANWATSRIRATLNGKENQTLSSYAGTDCLSTTNCLLSCFPSALANAIKPKYYTVPTAWTTSGTYPIGNTTTVSDKLWLMSGEEVYGQTGIPDYFKEFEKAQYTKKQNEGTTWSAYSKNKAYVWSASGGSSEFWWLRSPGRINQYIAGYVITNGYGSGNNVNYTRYGISPCFCLGSQEKPSYKVNYVVSVYGIGQDVVSGGSEVSGLTFGPAVGEDVSCLDVDGHEHHSAGKHCIHEDSWEEIIEHCNNGEWDLYSECIDYGCTKNIELKLNDTIKGGDSYKDKTASVLYNSINGSYRKWNNTYSSSSTDSEQADWATSRIRATLNGKTGSESTWAGTDCLDSTNCLLSCFPESLQGAIKAKYYKVPINWSTSSSTGYQITDSVDVEDKLWLMNAEEVYGESIKTDLYGRYVVEWGKDQYQRNASRAVTTSNYRMNIGFNESSSAYFRWLRCPSRNFFYFAGGVTIDGSFNGGTVTTSIGLSACFCLGAQEKPEPPHTLQFNANGGEFSDTDNSYSNDIIEIGDGTATSYNTPMNNYYKYSTNETIYLKDEIGMAGKISKISYNVAASAAVSCDQFDIYMAHTNKSSFSGQADWIPSSDLVKVYSNNSKTIGSNTGWEEIVLDTPFEYNGEDNLAIIVCKHCSSYSNTLKYYNTSKTSRCLYKQNDNTTTYSDPTAGGNGTVTNEMTNIKIEITSTLKTRDMYVKNGDGNVYEDEWCSEIGSVPTCVKSGNWEFLGWFDATDGGNKVLNTDGSFAGAVSGYTDGNVWVVDGDRVLYAQYKSVDPKPTLNYMVNIYGIGQDAVDGGAHTAGLTFGPAVGETADCLHVDGHEVHGHDKGGHCICEDSWDEIIKNCNEGHADYYSSCLDYHCAKSVPITLNSAIGVQPTEDQYASILYNSINESYRKWNDSYSSSDAESANWATSRIRATLNGANGEESTYAGDNLLTSSTCLLSCFPSNLQTAIKPKYYQVPVTWQTSSSTTPPYRIDTSVYLNDKLWLMNAEEVFGTSVQSYSSGRYWEWGKAQYKRNLDAGITTSAYSNNIAYTESSSATYRWLRCPIRNNFYSAGTVFDTGFLYGHYVGDFTGLSACFCLGESGNITESDYERLGLANNLQNKLTATDIVPLSPIDNGELKVENEEVGEERVEEAVSGRDEAGREVGRKEATVVEGSEGTGQSGMDGSQTSVAVSTLALVGLAVCGSRRVLRGRHERVDGVGEKLKRRVLKTIK